MRTKIHCIALLLLLVLVGCATTTSVWHKTQQLNTVDAYQTAREKDTIEAYESFLKVPYEKDHYEHQAAEKRLRQLRYERAVRTGTLEDWKAFYDEYRYWSLD